MILGNVHSSCEVNLTSKPELERPRGCFDLALLAPFLQKKIQLADTYDEAIDKDFFYQQHGKYNVLIGRALRMVREAYSRRLGRMGRLEGAKKGASSAKSKHPLRGSSSGLDVRFTSQRSVHFQGSHLTIVRG